jgi:hypothetical protein
MEDESDGGRQGKVWYRESGGIRRGKRAAPDQHNQTSNRLTTAN